MLLDGGRKGLFAGVLLCCLTCFGAQAADAQASGAPADSFAGSMDAAMARMDHDMMMTPSGNADRDFATMMIPHHQGAIEMAEAELKFGHDPVLRRLAEGIIVEQGKEIRIMRQALAGLPPATSPSGVMVMPGRQ